MIGLIKKILLFFCCLLFVFALLLVLNSLLYVPPKPIVSNTSAIVKNYTSSFSNSNTIEHLQEKFGKKKTIPKEYEKQILIALSHFPELENVKIEFIVKKSNFPLQSHPAPLSLISLSAERKYRIIISNDLKEEYKSIQLSNIPFNGQIGVIGHELSHTFFYLNKNSLELAWIGINYFLSPGFRNRFERLTDQITIVHGLGYQLLDWRIFFERLDLSRETEGMKIYFENRYLTAKEIKELMSQNERYTD